MLLKRLRSRLGVALMLLAGAFSLQSCLDSDGDSYDAFAQLEEDIKTIQAYLDDNNIDAVLDSATGVFYQIHSKGNGYRTINGIDVDVHYQGLTLDGNTEFVNTFDGASERITLGNADANPSHFTGGLNIGLLFMSEGDSATIYVPSPYGFQNRPYFEVPENSILKYNAKFEDVLMLDEDYAKIDQYIADSSMNVTIEPEYGIRTVVHKEGNSTAPEVGALVTLHYQGELLDGTVFDSSIPSNAPLSFTLGDGNTIIGFEMGISQLHEDDSATIFIPSIYAYGDSPPSGSEIPSNAVLVFGIEMLNVTNFE